MYGVDTRTRPALPTFKIRTVEQFDGWLAAKGKTPADRSSGRH